MIQYVVNSSYLQWNKMNYSESPVKLNETQWKKHNQSLWFTLHHHNSYQITLFHLWSLVVDILTHNLWISMNTSDLMWTHVNPCELVWTCVNMHEPMWTHVIYCSIFMLDHWCSLRFISYVSRYTYTTSDHKWKRVIWCELWWCNVNPSNRLCLLLQYFTGFHWVSLSFTGDSLGFTVL